MRKLCMPLSCTLFLVCGVSLLTLTNCKKEEVAKSGINGFVQIDGAPAGGVLVVLYREPELDSTTVWYQTARNLAVGFRYSPQAAFDWRRDDRLRIDSVLTAGDGSFQFEGLDDNDYIICARKRYERGTYHYWNWTLPKTVSLRGASADLGTLHLYEPVIVPRLPISGNETWLSGHHYILEGDLDIDPAGSLTLEPGTFVQLPYNGRIRVRGLLNAIGSEEDYITLTSIADSPEAGQWLYVYGLTGSAKPVFRYCRFDYGAEAARVQFNSGATFEYCYFTELATDGLSFLGALNDEEVTIDRCVFNRIGAAVEVRRCENLSVSHSIFYSCHSYGMRAVGVRGGEIFCNWFQDCGRYDTMATERSGVMLLGDIQDFEIYRNHTLESAYAHDVGSSVDSTVNIHHNTYQSVNRVLNIGVTEEELVFSNPRFNYNCMVSIDKINVIVHTCRVNTHDVDCSNNFWNNDSPSDIYRLMISDCSADEEHRSFVHIEPIIMQCPSDAGICRN